jgi:CHAT domain-containing protein
MRRLSTTLLGNLHPSSLPPLVILVLDGDLHRVPFAALQLTDGEYLGIRHDLVQAPSAAFLQQGSPPDTPTASPKSILAVYDPVFTDDDPRIPEALRKPPSPNARALARLAFDDELQTIFQLVAPSQRDFRKGFDASVLTLESLPLNQYAILHLSTHAIIDDEIPELSRIALSAFDRKGHSVDGFLFPYQLANLHLQHATVVLSACKTSLGKKVLGEGLAGFSSSLFAAGASQLVLSLSEIDAKASSIFFVNTYGRIFGVRQDAMEHALTLARRRFLLSSQWSDPYYWASFVVVGIPAQTATISGAPH